MLLLLFVFVYPVTYQSPKNSIMSLYSSPARGLQAQPQVMAGGVPQANVMPAMPQMMTTGAAMQPMYMAAAQPQMVAAPRMPMMYPQHATGPPMQQQLMQQQMLAQQQQQQMTMVNALPLGAWLAQLFAN